MDINTPKRIKVLRIVLFVLLILLVTLVGASIITSIAITIRNYIKEGEFFVELPHNWLGRTIKTFSIPFIWGYIVFGTITTVVDVLFVINLAHCIVDEKMNMTTIILGIAQSIPLLLQIPSMLSSSYTFEIFLKENGLKFLSFTCFIVFCVLLPFYHHYGSDYEIKNYPQEEEIINPDITLVDLPEQN